MKKNKLLKNVFLIALIIWIVMLIKQQINISQYKDDMKELSSKIEMYLQNERVYVDSNM